MVAVAAGVVLLAGGNAQAHLVADVEISSPKEGEAVSAPIVVSVVVTPTDEFASAGFSLFLDGQPVDRDGTVGAGAAFTGLSVVTGTPLTIKVRSLAAGSHQLRLVYAPDADSSKEDQVRTFTVRGASSRSPGRGRSVAVGIVFVLLLAASITLRRKGLRQR